MQERDILLMNKRNRILMIMIWEFYIINRWKEG